MPPLVVGELRVPFLLAAALLLLTAFGTGSAQNGVLDIGDLARGRTFTVSSTCGLTGPQTFCALEHTNTTTLDTMNGGVECFTCDSSDPEISHPARFLSDSLATGTWWQSETGIEDVTLELQLEALFSFSELVVAFRSPRPASLVVERSRDFGATYEPYQFYSSDCEGDFGMPDRSGVVTSADEVICTSQYSSIEPLTNGEVTYRAVPPSLGDTDYNSPVVINKTTLTNLRIRFIRLNVLPGDDLSDPITALSYQYAIYSIAVKGSCFCNGRSLTCAPRQNITQSEPEMVHSECQCTGNTDGPNCDRCLPLFNDRLWLPANGPGETLDSSRHCQECQCYGRATSCHFDPQVAVETGGSGGVCDDCTGGTTGRMCHQCVVGFYRNSSAELSDPDLCIPCDCSVFGSRSSICNTTTGQCDCSEGFAGLTCDACAPSLFLPDPDSGCVPCDCNDQGSNSSVCRGEDGQCPCKPGVRGRRCDECRPDHFGFSPEGCTPCDCDPGGSARGDGVCDRESGECDCVEGVAGRRCDRCPVASVGPDRNMVRPCTDCFCNGYSRSCSPADGWYQANVVAGFDGGGIAMEGFRSDGDIFADRGCLEFDSLGASFYISLPDYILGDKRTSYNQLLSLNLSIPNMAPDDRCHVFVEVVGRSSRYRQIALVAELPPPSNQPQLLELPLLPGNRLLVDLWFWKRLASQRDIRQILADIRQFRLKVVFEPGTSPLTVRLCGVSLGYATTLLSDPFVTVPPKPVNYVENCSCPLNRRGPRCENCAPGYTTDPSFGGEFARCVRCFCNFHSASCDPLSGECFDCSDNTEGPDCERCRAGYFRESGLRTDPCMECECSEAGTEGGACRAVAGVCQCKQGYSGRRCDECSDGYWSPTTGQCIPCECDPEGSVGQSCNQATGGCSCLPRVAGEKCTHCEGNSTDLFPSCEPCDECTGQWQARINPLRAEVESALELARVTSMTPGPEGVPLLVVLLNLLGEVREILDDTRIDPELASNVTKLHERLCELTNQTQGLFERIVAVDNEIARLDGETESFENETSRLALLLAELRNDFENISGQFGNISIPEIDFESYLSIAQRAEERSTVADRLVSQNVTTLLSLTESLIEDYRSDLNESRLIEQQEENLRVLSAITQKVNEYESFLVQANAQLCGAALNSSGGGGGGTCGECGGLECDTCGGNPQCNGLVTMAAESLVVSRQALEVAEELRNQTRGRVALLRILFAEISVVTNETLDAEAAAREVQSSAERLFQEVTGLHDNLRRRLEEERIHPDIIEEVERETLSLSLPVTQEEFLEILVAINSTVEMIFSRFGVNSTDLQRRAESALERAENVNVLAEQLEANVSSLQSLLAELSDEERTILTDITLAETTNSDTQTAIEETNTALDQTNSSLLSTRDRLANLTLRLGALESQLARNLAALSVARGLTEEAENASAAVDLSSQELEESFAQLRNATDEKVGMSQEQLEEAESYRERTAALIERTSQQLLLEENLERRERDLLAEQEFIRGDVQRLSLQLEELNELIQVHIARNTACLDAGSLQKR